MELDELLRLLLNLVKPGRVIAVDHVNVKCRVECGALQTNWIRWMAPAAGDSIEWDPPTVGEQVLLLSPAGDMAQAVALRGLYADDTAPPTHSKDKHTRRYPDATEIEYDSATHKHTHRYNDSAVFEYDAGAHKHTHRYPDSTEIEYDAGAHKHAGRYPDSAVVEYDATTHTLTASLPAGAAVRIIAPAIVRIESAVVDASGSVRAAGNLSAGTGASGSFITPTGNVVTVMDGIITTIA